MGKILMNRLPVVKIRQTFPPSKFCAIRYLDMGTHHLIEEKYQKSLILPREMSSNIF